jgi:pimeloyl-ACP methyl ester carboxylesterase
VVLDAMGDGTSVNWGWVQPQVATVTRVCAYDRAGRGWSESGPEPRDAQHISQEIHTLLGNAGIEGPYIVVGHSFGGFTMRVFADQYADEVSGMVIIDGGQPDIDSPRFPAEARAKAEDEAKFMAAAPTLARFGLFRFVSGPPVDLPPQQRAAYAAFYASVRLWDSLYAEYLALPATNEQVRRTGSLGDRPLLVANADTAWLTYGAPADEARRVFNEMEAELLQLSTNSVQRIIPGATHGSLVLKQDHAQQTSAAIIAVVEAARTGRRLAP